MTTYLRRVAGILHYAFFADVFSLGGGAELCTANRRGSERGAWRGRIPRAEPPHVSAMLGARVGDGWTTAASPVTAARVRSRTRYSHEPWRSLLLTDIDVV